MRIVYFFRFESHFSGVEKKVNSQIHHLRANGTDCIAYYIYSDDPSKDHNDYVRILEMPHFNHKADILNKLRVELFFINILEEQISSLKDQDILFMRIPYPSYFLSRLLSRPRTCKIVIEYQSIEPLEYRSEGKYWYLLIDSLFGDAIRKYSDAIVGVTDEITQYELYRSGTINKPHITIGNGCNVDSIPLREPPHFSSNNLNLLCVTSVDSRHGLDRLIRGLALYRGPTTVTLHIAGEGPELPNLKSIVRELEILDMVKFHGYMTGKPLESLFDTCHLAVGSLGMHRQGLTQGSILKSREYIARGIPYVIACADPDVPDDFPYTHRVLPDESPVSIEAVIDFAQIISGDPEHPQKMRAYAMEHLDWSVKMNRLKKFFEILIDDNSNR